MCAARMREQFEIYSNGLFSVPVAIPGTPYGKAINARKIILDDIEREPTLPHALPAWHDTSAQCCSNTFWYLGLSKRMHAILEHACQSSSVRVLRQADL